MALGGGALPPHGGPEPANNRGGTRAAAGRDRTQVFAVLQKPAPPEAFAASASVLRTVAQTGVASAIDS